MWQICHALGQVFVGERVVAQVAVDVLVVRRHVDETMTTEVEEYHLALARLLALEGLADGGSDGAW